MSSRAHDLVVYGATGFVGALTAAHLAEHAPPGRPDRAGRAGRATGSRRCATRCRRRRTEWPLLEADATDPASLAALAAATRVVATTVGPYARYGLPLVEACARAGTHYADLTGEVLFVRAAIDRYDAPARGSGARIVHSCGYDSVPSDLWYCCCRARAAEARATCATSAWSRRPAAGQRRHRRLDPGPVRRDAARPRPAGWSPTRSR